MAERRVGAWAAACVTIALLAAPTVLAVAPTALADAGHGAEPSPTEAPSPPPEPGSQRLPGTVLTLTVPDGAGLGDEVRLQAFLTDLEGMPLEGATLSFVLATRWGELEEQMLLGTRQTDAVGVAMLVTDVRTSGDLEFGVRFEGDGRYRPSAASGTISISGDRQVYEPDVGLDVPGLGVWWLLVLVAAVWGLYALVVRQVVGIARAGAPGDEEPSLRDAPAPSGSRRRFLRASLLPAAALAGVAALGSGLITILSRSPRTHGNLGSPDLHATARHRLTPVSLVGTPSMHAELPPLLEREISFAGEVLPILVSKGGPHTHPSVSSPPPHGVHLDSHAALMGEEDPHAEDQPHAEDEEEAVEEAHGHQLVVRGRPEDSMLVMMLVDRAHQMPPSVPLSEAEIQLIASWVAQGAKDN